MKPPLFGLYKIWSCTSFILDNLGFGWKHLLIYSSTVVIHSHSDTHCGSHGNVSFNFLLTYAFLHALWLHFFSLGSSQFYDWLAKLISYSVLCLRRSDIPSTAIKQRGRIDGQERDAETLRIWMFCPPLNWSDACGWANVFIVIYISASYTYSGSALRQPRNLINYVWGDAFKLTSSYCMSYCEGNSITFLTKEWCREV